MVPLKVHTAFGPCVGRPGWNLSGIDWPALNPELRVDGTPGLYDVFVVACACDTSTPMRGGNCSKRWCAQIGPGGRPSMGPVPPPSSAGTGCCVWLASFVGAGLSAETAFRASRSKRSMGCVKGWTPNRGLGGAPVGTAP